jgi:hypothetical protein
MQTYITQLVEDLTAAQGVVSNTKQVPTLESFEDYIAEVERNLRDEGERCIKDIIDIQEVAFPPANRLNPAQLNAVSDAYLECLYSWNICIDMPENLPEALRYTLLISTLNTKIIVMAHGFTHIELCNYDSTCCPFGIEFCSCIETEGNTEYMDFL